MLREPAIAYREQHRFTTQGSAAYAALARVVYRSHAVRALSPAELHDLACVAQARNSREAVTGLMLYDDKHFFQWLEGPARAVASVMDSIVVDRRHTNVEILDKGVAERRMFAEWSMKLAAPGPGMTSWQCDVIEPPREIVEALRAQPKAAPALLARLVPDSCAVLNDLDADTASQRPLQQKTAAILRDVFLATVVPQLGLADGAAAGGRVSAPNPRALELAELLVAADQQAACDLLAELTDSGQRIGQLSAALFEPTARRLGDLWSEDFCSEFDVTLALCRLQSAARLFELVGPQRMPSKHAYPVVLIVPRPGELHRLGAALDGSVLRNMGWMPRCEYPPDDQSLHDLLSSTWFDVLNLSLSAAFRRDHALTAVAKTIARARRASRNPGLSVVVGGRVFAEEHAAGAAVGADHANTTAMNVNLAILNTVAATPNAMVAAEKCSAVS